MGVAIKGVFLPIQFHLGQWAFGFMWGYFYRQWLLDEGRLPLSSLRHHIAMEYLGFGMPETQEIDRLEQFRRRHGWKITLGSSVLLLSIGVISIITKIVVGIVISLVGALWAAFLSGYTYRQHVVDRGRCPKWQFLRLIGDCPDDDHDRNDSGGGDKG